MNQFQIRRSERQRIHSHTSKILRCPASIHDPDLGVQVGALQHVCDLMDQHVGQKPGTDSNSFALTRS